MKKLRQIIRRIILESTTTSKYAALASMLDSYELDKVQPAVELLIAPDSNSGGEPFAEIISHTISKGYSPMEQLRVTRPGSMSTQGPIGKSRLTEDPCFHIFKIRFNQPFLDYMKQINPSSMFLQDEVGSYEPTMIFAEKDGETWSDVSIKFNLDKRDLNVEVPI